MMISQTKESTTPIQAMIVPLTVLRRREMEMTQSTRPINSPTPRTSGPRMEKIKPSLANVSEA